MDDYSHKDFTGQTLIEANNLDNQVILNSCFSQESPDGNPVHCFPETMQGVNFINCNLENCFIPAGNQVFQLDRAGYPEGDE